MSSLAHRSYSAEITPAEIWQRSGLTQDGQWRHDVRMRATHAELRALEPYLEGDQIVVMASDDDALLLPGDTDPALQSKLTEAYERCAGLVTEMAPPLSNLRVLILARNPTAQQVTLFPNGAAIGLVDIDTALSTGGLYHEGAHLFGLTGHVTLDEGIAVFVENAAPNHSSVAAISRTDPWLGSLIRCRKDDRDPYTFGAAGLAAALKLTGVAGLQHLIQQGRDAVSDAAVSDMMRTVLREATAQLDRSLDGVDASSSPEADYFSGNHDAFIVHARALLQNDPDALTEQDWITLGRFASLTFAQRTPDAQNKADASHLDRIADHVPATAQGLFGIAKKMRIMRDAADPGAFIAASSDLMSRLDSLRDDPDLGADAAITLMYLYRYLPEFVGGSLPKAIALSKEMDKKYGWPEAAARLQSTLETRDATSV